jgi:broad specificity phosphatase PhoE
MSSSEQITVSLEDLRHVFDLAVDTPLLCSGSFDSDDVAVLRRLAELLHVDPEGVTPDEFIRDFPHKFRPYQRANRHISGTSDLRPETDEEFRERVGHGWGTCSAGSYFRRCHRPEDDPMHVRNVIK